MIEEIGAITATVVLVETFCIGVNMPAEKQLIATMTGIKKSEGGQKVSEETIVHYCAPTLAGMKTGNLFSCFFLSREEMTSEIRKYNRVLTKKGLAIIAMKFEEKTGRGLIYVFRPGKLKRDLENSEARRLLQESGYSMDHPFSCLRELVQRVNGREHFPHEIGLFLSYPPEDVRGFIQNRADHCKCVGTWKVYGDEDQAKKVFARYQKCCECYERCYERGASLSKLTVRS